MIPKLTEYWPEYLSHHRRRRTRQIHVVGDIVVVACFLASGVSGHIVLALIGLTLGYALVFASHFWIEKNRPATFRHPVLAGLCNWWMFALTLRGQLDAEYERFNIRMLP